MDKLPRIGIAYLTALLTLAGGGLLSLGVDDWYWLARAGSAVVVIGIVLTSRQIMDQLRRLRARRSHYEGDSRHDWAEDTVRFTIGRRRIDQYRWRDEGSGILLLILGTVVWGFGDLVGLLI